MQGMQWHAYRLAGAADPRQRPPALPEPQTLLERAVHVRVQEGR